MSNQKESNKIIHDFNEFICEYIFEFKLYNITPLSIGSGKKPFGVTDNPIVRIRRVNNGDIRCEPSNIPSFQEVVNKVNNGDIRFEPYIPGSSLKGILRSEAERFARTIYKDDPQTVCDIFLSANEQNSEKKREESNKDKYKPCLICTIFGGQTIASHVNIGNAFLINYEDKAVDVIRKVSINRLTGAQHAGRLYDVEHLTPHQEFNWILKFENIELLGNTKDNYENKVLNIIFYLLKKIIKEGIEVGGRRSIGYGRLIVKEWKVCKYELKDARIEESDVTNQIKNKLGIS